MNSNELKAERVRFGDTNQTLAEALGINPATCSAKTNGKADFTRKEMQNIKTRYNLSDERMSEIFFAD